MRSIQELRGEIKGLADDWLASWGSFVVVILACLASFALGRLSVLGEGGFTPTVTQMPLEAAKPPMRGGLLVGSKEGRTYHYPWCAGAARIAPENQRWFASAGAAQAQGYSAAKNCTGLEAE